MPAAAAPPFALGARAGTTGLGVDATLELSERAHLRLAAGTVGVDTTISTSNVDYDAQGDLGAALLLLDFYPGAGNFRVSVGGGWNGTEADVSAPVERLLRTRFPNLPVVPLDFGTLRGTAKGDDVVPAVLLGWGNPFRGGRIHLSFEVGAIYQGEPEVDLTYFPGDLPVEVIPGGAATVAVLLADQERQLEKELEDYTILPVVSFTLSFRF